MVCLLLVILTSVHLSNVLLQVKGTQLEDGSIKKGAPVLIVLSDGESRDRLTQRDQYIIDKFQRDSRLQIAVGVGDNFNRDELGRGLSILFFS